MLEPTTLPTAIPPAPPQGSLHAHDQFRCARSERHHRQADDQWAQAEPKRQRGGASYERARGDEEEDEAAREGEKGQRHGKVRRPPVNEGHVRRIPPYESSHRPPRCRAGHPRGPPEAGLLGSDDSCLACALHQLVEGVA